MSRTLPYECPHGVTVDWCDFGPCQDCADHPGDRCPNFTECEDCADDRVDRLMDAVKVATNGRVHLDGEEAALALRLFVASRDEESA